MELILSNPEAVVQVLAAVTTTIVTLSSVIIKFFWQDRPKSRKGRKIKGFINTLALNSTEVKE